MLHNAREGKAMGWFVSKIRKGKKLTSEKNDKYIRGFHIPFL